MTGTVAQSTNGPQAGGDGGPLLEVEDLVVRYHIRGPGKVVRSHETRQHLNYLGNFALWDYHNTICGIAEY